MGSVYLSRDDEARARQSIARSRTDRVAFARAFFGLDLGERQAELLRMRGSVQTAVAGRRFGKSLGTLVKAVHACVTRRDQEWYVTAPSIDQAYLYFQELERYMDRNPLLARLVVPGTLKMNPFPEVRFVSGSIMRGRSTTLDGKYLRGKGADGVCVSEAAFVKDVVWYEVIRALLLDRKGTALVETTPNGAGNWTYKLYQLGLEDGTGYYSSFHASCHDNPKLDRLEIERIRREIPDLAFRQEYLAEFVDDDSAVFPWRVLQEVLEDYRPLGKPVLEHRYTIGVDLAKHRDWTVACVLDVTQEPFRVAEWHRLQGVLYTDVAALVNEIQERYQVRAWMDTTGVGDAVAEQVDSPNAFVFTPKSREELISGLVVALENQRVLLPSSIRELRDELRYFRRVQHGVSVKAEAPSGQHDDCVFALALAVHGAQGSGYEGLMGYYRQMRERLTVIRGGAGA